MKNRPTLAFIFAGSLLAAACGSGGSGGAASGGKSGSGGASSAGSGGGSGTGGSSASGGSGTGGAGAKGGSGGTSSGDPGTPITFTVDPSQDNHAISPYIYCQSVSKASDATTVGDLAKTNGLRLVRVGGNRFSAYNWENNASNAGSDYQFQNDDYLSASDVPGDAMEGALAAADAGLIATLLTGQLAD